MFEEERQKRIISVQSTKKIQLNDIIQQDTAFLRKFDIMDYSLFLVVEHRSDIIRHLTHNEFLSQDGSELYHISIIDFLQQWNLNKKCERLLKGIKNYNKIDKISAIEPGIYRRRFIDFMSFEVFQSDKEIKEKCENNLINNTIFTPHITVKKISEQNMDEFDSSISSSIIIDEESSNQDES